MRRVWPERQVNALPRVAVSQKSEVDSVWTVETAIGRCERRAGDIRIEPPPPATLPHSAAKTDLPICPTVADLLSCRQIKLEERELWILGVSHWLNLSRLGTPRCRRHGHGRARLQVRSCPRARGVRKRRHPVLFV